MQEERRMSSVKYQVHDETSQVSYNYLFKIWSWFVFSNQMDRPYVLCFQISCLRFVTYLERYFLYEFQFFFLIFTKWGAKNVDEHASFLLIIILLQLLDDGNIVYLKLLFSGLHALPPTVVGVKRIK